MQAHFLRYSCEIFTTKTCYVENKNIRLSIEKMRKMMLAMLRMRMCCCRISGGGSSNRLFATGGFIIVPPFYTITSHLDFFLFSPHLSLILSPLFPLTLLLYSRSVSPIHFFYSVLFLISAITFAPVLHIYLPP